jgi:hypothetical protein
MSVQNIRRFLTASLLLLLAVANAGTLVTTLGNLNADDSLDWGPFGASGVSPNGPSNVNFLMVIDFLRAP